MELKERSLMELSDEELQESLKIHANRNLIFSYNDVRLEIERRAQQKHNDRTFYWSVVAVIISVISLFASILVALFK